MITRAQQMMIDDGLPAELLISEEDRRAAWKDLTPRHTIDFADGARRPANPADEPAITPGENVMIAKAVAKKAKTPKKAKATKTSSKAQAAHQARSGNVRPGTKLELVVTLLTRKEGCTTADILKATDWPSVSVPQQAKAAGLTLRKEKDGNVTRYWGS